MSGPWRVAGVSTDGSVADIKDDTHCVANGVRIDKAELICQEHNAAAPTAADQDARDAIIEAAHSYRAAMAEPIYVGGNPQRCEQARAVLFALLAAGPPAPAPAPRTPGDA